MGLLIINRSGFYFPTVVVDVPAQVYMQKFTVLTYLLLHSPPPEVHPETRLMSKQREPPDTVRQRRKWSKKKCIERNGKLSRDVTQLVILKRLLISMRSTK